MPLKGKPSPPWWHFLVAGGGFVAAVTWVQDYSKFRSDMADKPYVNERFVDAKKYTDDTGTSILGKAYSYSDANRQSMTIKMEEIRAEMRESNAKLSTQIDQLIKTVEGATWRPRSK